MLVIHTARLFDVWVDLIVQVVLGHANTASGSTKALALNFWSRVSPLMSFIARNGRPSANSPTW